MKLSVVRGIIDRRLLVNYRIDPPAEIPNGARRAYDAAKVCD